MEKGNCHENLKICKKRNKVKKTSFEIFTVSFVKHLFQI